jgi:hypothetical protein
MLDLKFPGINTYKKNRGGCERNPLPRGEVPGKGSFAGRQVGGVNSWRHSETAFGGEESAVFALEHVAHPQNIRIKRLAARPPESFGCGLYLGPATIRVRALLGARHNQ